MTTVAVIGGTSSSLSCSSIGHAAEELGDLLAQRNANVMTCGVRSGVIGILLDSLQGSSVPRSAIVLRGIEESSQHPAAGPVTLVDSVEERKLLFMTQASEILALPGGLGTHDEILSFLMLMKGTSRNLGLLNVDGYFNPLLDQLSNMIHVGFAKAKLLQSIRIYSCVEDIVGYP